MWNSSIPDLGFIFGPSEKLGERRPVLILFYAFGIIFGLF